MKEDNEKRLNDFKVKIIRQLKDSNSAFNCLLGKRDYASRKGPWRTNARVSDYGLSASEFNLTLMFTWDESVSPGVQLFSFFPRDDGGHNVSFIEGENCLFLDISRNEVLEDLTISEEYIEPSLKNPKAITFGFRTFYVAHEDYEYYKVYNGEWSVDFDIEKLNFILESEHSPFSVEQFVKTWDEHLQYDAPEKDMIFLDYIHDDTKYYNMSSHLIGCGLEDEARQRILDAIADGYHNPSSNGELRFIMELFEKMTKSK